MNCKRFVLFFTATLILSSITAQTETSALVKNANSGYNLSNFLEESTELDRLTDSIFQSLSSEVRVSQLIMPAVGRYGQHEDTIVALIKDRRIGGVLMLNGSKSGFTELISGYNNLLSASGQLPFLYSADAEPSLVNRKITGSQVVSKANEIHSEEEVRRVAQLISSDLNSIGINYNFAPVVDLSPNKTVGYRGFGAIPENVIPFSQAFIHQTQSQNIIATAKHFPGHGLVSGDTHKSLQMIDGPLKELSNYPPLIESGVLSIMVAHIAVKNNEKFNTNGLPATTSKTIVQDLLRDSLQFKGLIVTDAMNMGGVTQVKNASVMAIDAGCDILLMPLDARKSHREILQEYERNNDFKNKVDLAAKRIIRMKICLGLIPDNH